ncbi:MAG: hypothetical protein NHB14_10225 [Desulfosporosinus sp.]|nr:hypothetical protein [Desulfosporosinus sp.]
MSDRILHLSADEFEDELKNFKGLIALDFFPRIVLLVLSWHRSMCEWQKNSPM